MPGIAGPANGRGATAGDLPLPRANGRTTGRSFRHDTAYCLFSRVDDVNEHRSSRRRCLHLIPSASVAAPRRSGAESLLNAYSRAVLAALQRGCVQTAMVVQALLARRREEVVRMVGRQQGDEREIPVRVPLMRDEDQDKEASNPASVQERVSPAEQAQINQDQALAAGEENDI